MSVDVALTVPERSVDLAFTIGAGETVALLGPNGAGKSTVIDAVAGLVRPRTGHVRIDGHVLTAVQNGSARRFVPPHRRQVALLAQDPLLFPHLTAIENVAFGPRSRGAARRTARA